MADSLYEEQIRWARMLRGDLMVVEPKKVDVPEIELSEVVREPLEKDQHLAVPTPPEVKPHMNGFGDCTVCHNHRRLWSGVCAWCGADPEDFEGEKQ